MSNNYQDRFEKIWKALGEINESARAREEERRKFRRQVAKEQQQVAKQYAEERRQIAKQYAEERRQIAKQYAEERRWYAEERRRFAKENEERTRVLNKEMEQLKKQTEKARRKADEASRKADEASRRADEARRRADEAQEKTEAQFRRTDEQIRITQQVVAETREFMKELGRQFGHFGNSAGALVEGVSAPSVKRILREHFEVSEFFPQRKRTINGENFETELIGVAEDYLERVYIVEIKARFGGKGHRQLLSNLKRFSRFYPEFQDLELYGMMASPRMTEHDERWAFRNGIYPLAVADDLYTLKVPEGFEAKNYGSMLPSSPFGVYRDLPGKWIEYR